MPFRTRELRTDYGIMQFDRVAILVAKQFQLVDTNANFRTISLVRFSFQDELRELRKYYDFLQKSLVGIYFFGNCPNHELLIGLDMTYLW